MKITILGAAGVRTPQIVESVHIRQNTLGIDELCLMDIDAERLALIGSVTEPLEQSGDLKFKIKRTTDAREALKNADYVITTFRVGGIESRVIDERVALNNGVLGQETTGPGGFAMAIRTIPVLLDYIKMMEELCPNAWLINFANPSGMLAEVILRIAGWKHAVGICDGPSTMKRVASKVLGANYRDVYLDYFGLNHLGWVRSVIYNGHDMLPMFLETIDQHLESLDLPFSAELIKSLGMIPNEYLYYFYSSRQAVQRILTAEQTRGEQILEQNKSLFADLKKLQGNPEALLNCYIDYQLRRWETYMTAETGQKKAKPTERITPETAKNMAEEGYAGVALDLIEALNGNNPQILILNVLNEGAVEGIDADASVEIPAYVGKGLVKPMNVGKIPAHCLGLMSQVKAYEQLTMQAAVERSYQKALQALTIHPLVEDSALAKRILDGYLKEHGSYFPKLS
jgi:6-phospho-beta-glucosidase